MTTIPISTQYQRKAISVLGGFDLLNKVDNTELPTSNVVRAWVMQNMYSLPSQPLTNLGIAVGIPQEKRDVFLIAVGRYTVALAPDDYFGK